MSDERFEALFAERAALEPEDVAAMWDGSTYKSPGYNVELAWDFWCAGSKAYLFATAAAAVYLRIYK